MKRSLKNKTCIALSCAALSAFFAGGVLAVICGGNAGAIEAYADGGESSFEMVKGASVRFEEPNGIRFQAKLGEAETYTEIENTKYYMMIVPYDYIKNDHWEITENYYENLLAKFSENGVENPFIANMLCEPFKASDEADGKEYYYVRGSLANVKYDNVNRDFFGIAYYTQMDENGDISSVYASFNEGENVRNIVEVASAALNEETNAEKISALQTLTYQGLNQASGVAEENKNQKPDYNLSLESDNFELLKGENGQTATLQISGPETTADIAVKYSSENKNVAIVNNEGVITATGEGETNIIVKQLGETLTATVRVSKLNAPEISYTRNAAGNVVASVKNSGDEGEIAVYKTTVLSGEKSETDITAQLTNGEYTVTEDCYLYAKSISGEVKSEASTPVFIDKDYGKTYTNYLKESATLITGFNSETAVSTAENKPAAYPYSWYTLEEANLSCVTNTQTDVGTYTGLAFNGASAGSKKKGFTYRFAGIAAESIGTIGVEICSTAPTAFQYSNMYFNVLVGGKVYKITPIIYTTVNPSSGATSANTSDTTHGGNWAYIYVIKVDIAAWLAANSNLAGKKIDGVYFAVGKNGISSQFVCDNVFYIAPAAATQE